MRTALFWEDGTDRLSRNVGKELPLVADHLVQSFIRFAGANYAWYVNVRLGTFGDR